MASRRNGKQVINWDRLTDIFEESLDLEGDQRRHFLDRQCSGDAVLRAQVERLLQHHAAVGSFIEEPVFAHLPVAPAFTPRFKQGDLLAERFRVVRLIGSGGMGEVYEVEDLTLGIRVAAKVLLQKLVSSECMVAQFKKEVQLARAVTHPNICRVYDVATHRTEELDGTPSDAIFFTMELLSGETLSSQLQKGPLPAPLALCIADQLVAGTAAAHGAGILHGDLKPANVVLIEEPGRVRAAITDFGLARVAGSATVLPQMGTLAYLAPEQLTGADTTFASDIYALGLIILEVLTGQAPRSGGDAGLSTLTQSEAKLDSVWKKVLTRCLNADPERRYGSVVELERDLHVLRSLHPSRAKRIAVGTAIFVLTAGPLLFTISLFHKDLSVPQRNLPAVAVLAFRNDSQAPDSHWLSAALPEALTSLINSTPGVRATSRIEVMRARRDLGLGFTELDHSAVRRLARSLRARFVVSGAYTLAPDGRLQLKVYAQDVGKPSGTFITEQSGQEQDILSMVTAIGGDLRKFLGATHAGSGPTAPGPLPSDLEAAKLYVEGIQQLRTYNFGRATELLEQAAVIDPQFPLIHSSLAETWLSAGYKRKAQNQARQALALSASLSREERLRVEGIYFEALENWDQAVKRFASLWHFQPDNTEYGLHYAGVLRAGGKHATALAVLAELRRRQSGPEVPEDPRIDLSEARAYYLMGDHRRACQFARSGAGKAAALGFKLPIAEARLLEGRAQLRLQDLDAAIASFREAERIYSAENFRAGRAHAARELAAALRQARNSREALLKASEALALFQDVGDMAATATVLRSRAEILRSLGDVSGAQQAMAEAGRITSDLGAL
ncbi:MAG TPA: protein kinase [Bryobacteraceae bacterium]|nr:protein kinase [Bryobacteraceae bacterium]